MSGTYEVSQFNPATLTSSISPLCVTNSNVNLMNIVQSAVNGTWTGQGVTGGSGNYVLTPSSFTTQGAITSNYVLTYTTSSNPNKLACPDRSTLNVTVTKTLTPSITQVQPFCNVGSPINMTVNPSGGTWSGAGISQQGVVTPSLYTQSGNNTVNYVLNIGPCVNNASTVLQVAKYYSAALTGSVSNLCVTSNPVKLMNIAQNTLTGTWSGLGVSNNSFIPAPSLSTGIYVLTYSTVSSPNINLCNESTTIAVSLLNPPVPSITQVGPYCSKGSPAQMTVSPATGYWTSSSFLNSNGVFTPSLASIGNNAVQYVIGTSTCNTQQTKYISVEAFVPASILSAIPDQCNTGSQMNLLPFTQSNQGVWSGPGISGTSFNPAVAGAGNFILGYSTASSPSGLCPDHSTVAVSVYSLAPPVITPVNPLCNATKPIKIQVSPVGGLFGGANTSAVSLGGLFNPGSAVFGANIINYSITSGPCVAYAQATINVEKYVPASFDKHIDKLCVTNDPVDLISLVQNPGGEWIGQGMVGSVFHPEKAPLAANSITYITHSSPNGLCRDTAITTIQVNGVPQVTVLSNIDRGCAPVEVVLNTTSNNGEGSWDVGDGSAVIDGLTTTYVYKNPGVYNITFSFNDKVCKTTTVLPYPITVYASPKADFSYPDEILISNPEVQITNQTTVLTENKYTWEIDGSVTANKEVHPVFDFPKIGRYQITLIAQTPNGCKDEVTKTLEVKNDFNIYIPTSFSPNFDGLNDIFIPVFSQYGLDAKSFEMEIFDRWGHSLYRSKDITKGWDGLDRSGDPMKPDIYSYTLRLKTYDGDVINKMGHVVLVR